MLMSGQRRVASDSVPERRGGRGSSRFGWGWPLSRQIAVDDGLGGILA
jgi:hypothetical protein